MSGKRKAKDPVLSTAQLERLRDTLRGIPSDDPQYPPTVEGLFQLAGLPASRDSMAALASMDRAARFVRISAKDAKKPSERYFHDALAFLPEDAEAIADSSSLLSWVLRASQTPATNLFSPGSLGGQLPGAMKKLLVAAIKRRIANDDLPPGIGMLKQSGHPKVFLLASITQGKAAQPTRSRIEVHDVSDFSPPARTGPTDAVPRRDHFVDDFEQAFERLDVQSGRHNYVLLHDLRLALSDVPRNEFDAKLNELRRNKRFSLDSAEGRHVRLTPEQLAAGIREANSLLVFVARR